MTKTILTTWAVATYDVLGSRAEGYEVNDVYRRGTVDIRLKVKTANAGKPGEFKHAYPSDYQLRKVFGVACHLDTDGDDMHITVNRASDGYPIGELSCESHASLSPIRECA